MLADPIASDLLHIFHTMKIIFLLPVWTEYKLIVHNYSFECNTSCQDNGMTDRLSSHNLVAYKKEFLTCCVYFLC